MKRSICIALAMLFTSPALAVCLDPYGCTGRSIIQQLNEPPLYDPQVVNPSYLRDGRNEQERNRNLYESPRYQNDDHGFGSARPRKLY